MKKKNGVFFLQNTLSRSRDIQVKKKQVMTR